MIPVEWHAAINATPSCMTLRRALADYLEEQGDEMAAECIRWSIEKGRTPYGSPDFDFMWYEYPGYITVNRTEDIPPTLHTKLLPKRMDDKTPAGAFIRLIVGWKNSTPEQRRSYWEWEPAAQQEKA